jgi:protein-L-isoaspartate(D-aspartate) O-methyltransferase
MVDQQLRARGVDAPLVLQAMGRVRREDYVSEDLRDHAYDDGPLPIEEGQTISQPYIVGAMLQALDLRGGERVLDVGTGSGYAAAVLAEIAGEVFTIERHRILADMAAARLVRDGYRNVRVRHGDGTRGWAGAAPFDAIVVAAAANTIPNALREQLVVGGRLVMPVGPSVHSQKLLRLTRTDEDCFETEELADVRFVPLVDEGA